MATIEPTARTKVQRKAERATYDRATMESILDAAPICHIGFVSEGQPYVIPTIHARVGERIFVHGARANRTLAAMRAGAPLCLTATILDGLVLARSAFHHSMNYRSVVVLGRAVELVEIEEKRAALEAIVEHVLPGRSREVRAPSEKELRATAVFALPLEEASAKIRTGGPVDAAEDMRLGCWAGVVPLELCALAPVADEALADGIPLSAAVAALIGEEAMEASVAASD
ncbi:MAG TPA: pyridoxamine 5'-phosphate oxidase family protein [Gammaproteobacteria bacterium]|nr:pyridoxamine 5'-phosphate oxidase family protein [Gammaproteobacteria bacterium]